MSIIGILSSNLFSASAPQNTQNTQGPRANAPRFEQIREEFQQLGQDLQSGNLTQAQSDYATLSKSFSGASQTGAITGATAATTGATPTATTTGSTSLAQQFAQLGQDLQSGNLQAAQKDFTNLQQTAQQNIGQQIQGHHRHGHHHHGGGTEFASSSQQSNPISQAFSTLGQDLQAGNLSGAQSAFATLQNDLQQIGGLVSSGSSGTGGTASLSSTATSTNAGSLNVTA